MLAYYSSGTKNTKDFVERLGAIPAFQITGKNIKLDIPYILIVPSYSDSDGRFAIAKPVQSFLKESKDNLIAVIGCGNKSFGQSFAIAANIISYRLQKPFIYSFELKGNEEDVKNVINIYKETFNGK